MLSPSRSPSQKIALTTIRPVSFSCVYFTCIKKSTTSVALTVAMARATTMLNGPRSMKAAPTVRPVPTSNAIQIATEEPMVETCSEAELWSAMLISPVTVDQVQQREQINPNNIDKVPVQPRVFDGRVISGTILAAPCRQGIQTGRRR